MWPEAIVERPVRGDEGTGAGKSARVGTPGAGGEIGRRSGFRFHRRKAWGFESPPAHHEEIIGEPGTDTNERDVSTTQSTTLSAARTSAREPARTVAVRHLAEDIALAHAQGDTTTARALASALSSLVGAPEPEPGDVIDIESARKRRP